MKKISLLIALSSTAFAFAETASNVSLNDNLVWTEAEASITGGYPSIAAFDGSKDGSFTYSATNGTLTTNNQVQVGYWSVASQNRKYELNILGSGNTLVSGDTFAIGSNGGGVSNSGNQFIANITSSDTENVNVIKANQISLFSGSTNLDAAPEKGSVALLNLAGNTRIEGKSVSGYVKDTYLANLDINRDGNNNRINGGVSKVLVSNSNNSIFLNDLRMSTHGTFLNNPQAILELGGTGNHFQVKWMEVNNNKKENVSSVIKLSAGNSFVIGYDAQNSASDSRINVNMQAGLNFKDIYNAKTGELSNGSMFLFEAGVKDGNADVTTVEFNKNNTDKSNVINAFIVLDLTDIYGTVVGEQESHLFDFSQFDEVTNKGFFKDECEYYLQIGETIVGLNEEINGVKFTGVDYTNGLIFNYVIPEPSTYAAIFGALALAFVAYRRRK